MSIECPFCGFDNKEIDKKAIVFTCRHCNGTWRI